MPKRLKSLRPTLREKKRYIAFEVLAKRMPSIGSVNKEIHIAAHRLVGDVGLAMMGLQFLPERYHAGKGLLRVSHRYIDHARATLALVTAVGKTPVTLRSTGVSGILAKAYKRYIVH